MSSPILTPILMTAILALGGCAAGGRASSPATPVDPSLSAPVETGALAYLPAGTLDAKTLLGPPPTPDSPQGRADRAAFDSTRVLEGSTRWKIAQQDDDLWKGGALKRLACAMGHDVSQARTPRTLGLLHRMEMDVRTVNAPAKSFYNRTRPPIGNDKPICVAREPWLATNGSYPSGHAATAWSWALVLAETTPARADVLLGVGKEMGDSRVVCGVHFPTDIEAGRTVASALVSRLHADRTFNADLAAAKGELARAPAPTGCEG